MPTSIDLLVSLGERFHGFDLQFRRSGSHWPHPYRVRIHATKNERSEHRITTYGESVDAAVLALQIELNKIKLG